VRVAALYDIHGNLPALDAVLIEVVASGADTLVVGGDIAWGPFPAETIARLLAWDAPTVFVRGNADREVAGRLDASSGLDPAVAEINVWCSDQLSRKQRKWLAGQPLNAVLDVDGLGDVMFCHGSPRSDEEMLTTETPERRAVEALSSARQGVVVCGHTHIQFDRTVQGKRLVNAGSVGMPYEGAPGAYWAILGPRVELRCTIYDVEAAAAFMRSTGCPQVEEAFIDVLLHPPEPDATARHFESLAAGGS
jgi:putative phosphoesterase